MNFKKPRYFNSNYIEEILHEYGIENVANFLNPTENDLQTWRDLINIDNGLELIKQLPNNACIALLVDCDCDGFTSSAIIYQYLMRYNPNFSITPYFHEGKEHGLADRYEEIVDKKYHILIVPDAASNDYEYIKQMNCPVLILDHHEIEEDTKISDNCIIINNQISPLYKNKALSGAGVVFQFCRGLDEKLGVNYSMDYIDLAALGVCGDMMDGREIENQYLWKIGFKNIKNVFFKMFCEKQSFSMKSKINPMTVAFYIVPYINAMIRVGSMDEKIRLFYALIDGKKLVPSNKRGAKGTMDLIANEAIRECTNAKNHQDTDKKNIAAMLEDKIESEHLLDNKILLIRLDKNFKCSPNIRGLVCMQLAAKYKRPTIVGTLDDNGFISGSARGTDNAAISSFKDFLTNSGYFEFAQGHAGAFGCSIANEKLAAFHSFANEALKDVDFNENFYEPMFYRRGYDNDISDIIEAIAQYDDIWSQQCDEPKIVVDKIYLKASDISVIGKNLDTLKFKYNGIEYIKFFAKDLIAKLRGYENIEVSIYGKMGLNEFRGNVTPQIMIEDIDFKEMDLLEF